MIHNNRSKIAHWHCLLLCLLLLVITPLEVDACYSIPITGPSAICPNTTISYSVSQSQGITCNSWAQVNWKVIGDAQFMDQYGNLLGTQIICGGPGACPLLGPVYLKAFSNGPVTIQVQGTCGGVGAGTSSLNITVGLPAPVVSAPAVTCINNVITASASEISGAVSYTWYVPNSTWKVNSISGPVVTLGVPYTRNAMLNPEITIGSQIGNSTISARGNLSSCVGTFGSYALQINSTVPSTLQYFSGPSTSCISDYVVFSASPEANSNSYELGILDEYGSFLASIGSTSSTIGFQPDLYVYNPGTYQIAMRGINAGCGPGPWSYQYIQLTTCTSGGCGQGGICMFASPNPVHKKIKLSISPDPQETKRPQFSQSEFDSTPLQISISSASNGAIYYSETVTDKNPQIDALDIPDGIYVVTAKGLNKEKAIRIVVKH